MWIRFLHDYCGGKYKAGDEVDYLDRKVQPLIDDGVAEKIEKKTVKPVPKVEAAVATPVIAEKAAILADAPIKRGRPAKKESENE